MEYITQYIDLLDKWTEKYNKVDMELSLLRQSASGNLQQDMKRTYKLKEMEKSLEECRRNRMGLLQTIQETRTNYEMLALNIDNILFNNIVMIDQTLKNFDKLNILEQSLN